MLTVIFRNKYDAYRMHSGWPFSLHTPCPDRWGFEPSIDYQLLPGQKSGVFTGVYETKNAGASFAGGRLLHIFDERLEELEKLHRCFV